MSKQPQALTVLFADVTESSRLYRQLGDSAARSTIQACLASLVALLPRFGGRMVKTVGDAIMCVFPDATTGVNAAVEMQIAVNAGHGGGHPMRIHVGLHAGPVLLEDGDVYGDTVNAAAFLTNLAMADQILISEVTERELMAGFKGAVRPLFSAVLKGGSGESTIHQVLWRADNLDLTMVNLLSPRAISADSGSLLVTRNNDAIRVDNWRPLMSMGRAAECDITVQDTFVSRNHCSIRFARTSFYLADHSVNGTYVTLPSGDEIHLLRGETVLEGSGEIRLGRSRAEQTGEVVAYTRDRRSQYRV